jgi:hypothetical protein
MFNSYLVVMLLMYRYNEQWDRLLTKTAVVSLMIYEQSVILFSSTRPYFTIFYAAFLN